MVLAELWFTGKMPIPKGNIWHESSYVAIYGKMVNSRNGEQNEWLAGVWGQVGAVEKCVGL